MIFWKENKKILIQAILGLLFIGLVVFFIKNERSEVHQIRHYLRNADSVLVSFGMLTSLLFIILQGFLYYFCFRSVNQPVSLGTSVRIFLKRNFVSVFLPAGGLASLAFFTRELDREKISRNQIHYASSIYAFTGLFTVFLIAIPVLLSAALRQGISGRQVVAFLTLFLLISAIFITFLLVLRKGSLYYWIVRTFPRMEEILQEVTDTSLNKKAFVSAILISLLIEVIGILQMAIAIRALGLPLTIGTAAAGYITAVLFMVVSPFLKGLGAIELSTAFVLTRFGFTTIEAISVTLLFRFFEFWIPLTASALSFLFVRNNLVLRIIPGILAFILGMVNIISAMTPAIPSRVHRVLEILPLYAVNLSNYTVVVLGLFLLVVAAFLFKGLRIAWYITLGISVASLILHLTKAFDYEEALFVLFVIITLWVTRKQYFVKGDPKLRQTGIAMALISVIAVVVYGTVGFYFLDKRYFGIDFSFVQSVTYTLQNFFLYRSGDLNTVHAFATGFLYSINIAGFLSMSFLLYTLVRPLVYRSGTVELEHDQAQGLVERYGRSGLDYYKTLPDKTLFFSSTLQAFLSFRTAGNYAIVLEDPVRPEEEDFAVLLAEFDRYCADNGMKAVYYRVPEESLATYTSLGKRNMLIGQEACIDLSDFSLEGGGRKSIRNSCNKARDAGYTLKVYQPPVLEGILQKVRAVSQDWLAESGHREIVFSQGAFDEGILRNQVLFTVEGREEKIVAFLNVIPDYAPGECTYDLIRKIKDSPNGIMDFLMVEFFLHMKQQGYRSANLGFAPLSGIEKGKDLPERSVRFAYENIRSFAHYKGLREFKEKFDPHWSNRYMVYEHPYDLFYLPAALSRVFKP